MSTSVIVEEKMTAVQERKLTRINMFGFHLNSPSDFSDVLASVDALSSSM